jgi:DNA-binding LacI/PurR family transcriptional regulator
VAQPLKEIGSQSVNILMRLMSGKGKKNEAKKIVLNASLKIRKSSERIFFS